ncbi:MAG: ABC transporter ATP-binding protein [Candidatus Marinimicrobia bacterium]|nr:ABC transporter ATP-binding protein [Candidatus Neomarinimicrobiota bacterium]
MAPLFTADHIGKSFHLRPVLKDVSFTLSAGESVLLFGRNGCGKTTLLKILAAIMRPEKGQASLNGQALFTPGYRWRSAMVYLGHRANLYPALTARENLSLSLRLRRQAWDEEAFQKYLDRYGLAGREDEPVRVYSEGMLQRLGLIRLELAAWEIAYLDEPTAALDVDGAGLLAETFRRWRSMSRTILFTSHDLGWGVAQADRALLLSRGVIADDMPRPGEKDLVARLGREA